MNNVYIHFMCPSAPRLLGSSAPSAPRALGPFSPSAHRPLGSLGSLGLSAPRPLGPSAPRANLSQHGYVFFMFIYIYICIYIYIYIPQSYIYIYIDMHQAYIYIYMYMYTPHNEPPKAFTGQPLQRGHDLRASGIGRERYGRRWRGAWPADGQHRCVAYRWIVIAFPSPPSCIFQAAIKPLAFAL
jgi:hypothetical protein